MRTSPSAPGDHFREAAEVPRLTSVSSSALAKKAGPIFTLESGVMPGSQLPRQVNLPENRP
jgi:hypothetical protein